MLVRKQQGKSSSILPIFLSFSLFSLIALFLPFSDSVFLFAYFILTFVFYFYIISYHIISYHIISYHIISYHIITHSLFFFRFGNVLGMTGVTVAVASTLGSIWTQSPGAGTMSEFMLIATLTAMGKHECVSILISRCCCCSCLLMLLLMLLLLLLLLFMLLLSLLLLFLLLLLISLLSSFLSSIFHDRT